MSHRKRIAATTAVAVSFLTAAAALAGCGPVSGASAGSGPTTQVVAAAPSSSATGDTQQNQRTSPAIPAEPPLGAGQVGTLAQVPWAVVGAGWALAQYTTGSFQTAGPVTLYLIDPEGGMYRIYRWPATTEPWTLVSWSGDKSRVLLRQQGTSQPTFHQLTIATGHISTFTLPADVTSVVGYTRPTGQNILVEENGIVRYTLTGAFQTRLSAGTEDDGAVSAPNGTSEIVSGGPGVLLVSNSGAAIRFLPVPGAGGLGCRPVRWWNSATVLASCISGQVFAPRLWLVPVSGAAPTALTPQRTDGGPDFGDIDAWQLPSGLYLQALGACGPPFIAKQLATGAIQAVTVPGSNGNGIVVATAGSHLLVQEFSECDPGSTVVWFDPATNAVQKVLTKQPGTTGVASVIPFTADGEQPPAQG